ncbi:MAG: HDOD domain-containing protein [Deltaproteobacteria bacterium]|nr:HDOD domain-containing protein [Deltaproteobacteria bacterium]
MKKVNVYKIKPGMILGRDVKNRDGRLLFLKDLKLAQKEIRTLKMWGIPEIFIQIESQKEEQTETGSKLKDNKRTRQFLDNWFGNNDLKSPVIEMLYDICLSRLKNNQFEIPSFFEKKDDPAKLQPGKKIKPVKNIQRLLEDKLKLPSLPTIFSEINEAVQSPKCSGKDIAAIVSKDTSLSATLLKIVNSAYYGLGEKVESLNYAAMALGTRQVSSLALGITVINYFKGISDQRINMQSFWRHSIACGIAAKTLAAHVKGAVPDRVFIGGLLHDIGRLIFLNIYPAEFNALLNKSQILGAFLYQVEPECFGMDHARFGSLLAKTWNFSGKISRLIHHHHDDFKKEPPREVAIVYFANWLVNAIGIGSSGENGLPPMNINAWKVLDMPETMLESIVKQIDRQIVEAVKFFYE